MNAADALFSELGFDGAGTREIAKRSGVFRSQIHYHFENKQVLFNAVLERHYEKLNLILGEAFESGEDLNEKLSLSLKAYMDFIFQNRNFSKFMVLEAISGRHLEYVTERLTPIMSAVKREIEQSYPKTARGKFSPANLFVSLYGMLISYFLFGPIVGPIIGVDLMTDEELEIRKKHLEVAVELLIGRMAHEEAGSE